MKAAEFTANFDHLRQVQPALEFEVMRLPEFVRDRELVELVKRAAPKRLKVGDRMITRQLKPANDGFVKMTSKRTGKEYNLSAWAVKFIKMTKVAV
jgi:hypothetical protein